MRIDKVRKYQSLPLKIYFYSRVVLMVAVFFSLPLELFANGAPVLVKAGALGNRSELTYQRVPEVKLKKEELVIVPAPDKTQVQVTYILESQIDKKVDYVFPVTVCGDGYSEATVPSEKNLPRQVGIFLNGEKLPVTETWVQAKSKLPTTDPDYMGSSYAQCSVHSRGETQLSEIRWQTQLGLKKGEQILKVEYEVALAQSAWPRILLAPEISNYFHYDFSPASYWGNGQVSELTIQINIAKVKLQQSIVLIYEEKLIPWRQEGDFLKTELKNINLAKLKPFNFSFPAVLRR